MGSKRQRGDSSASYLWIVDTKTCKAECIEVHPLSCGGRGALPSLYALDGSSADGVSLSLVCGFLISFLLVDHLEGVVLFSLLSSSS